MHNAVLYYVHTYINKTSRCTVHLMPKCTVYIWNVQLSLDCAKNVELQNAEFQNIELQNAELQNAELQNVESYRTANLTECRNTKRRILQNVEIQNVENTIKA
jgi:uncharacterized protein YjbI with pentapeptide repeats